ncbi:MAG: hypothetical protein K8L97_03340 [Anaerolineae bacterium]|nr:hypothetical protein [Anaerolineae bacterium]
MYKTGWQHHQHSWHSGHGHGWGGRHHHHRGFHGGFFVLPGLLLMGFLFFGLLKFLWPLLLIGFLFAMFNGFMRGGMHRRNWGADWQEKWKREWGDEKFKNEEKAKRGYDDDAPRFTRTADGDWVEII